MKNLKVLFILMLAFAMASCGDEGAASFNFQSDRCNDGDQATLSLNINGVGAFTFTEGSSAVSHASDTEGSGIDAVSLYMVWVDPITGDSIRYDVTVENETLSEATYNYNPASFNGTVNFYIYKSGLLDAHYTFDDWTTTIDEYEVYEMSSGGGFSNTRLAFVRASTSGTFIKVGSGSSHAFTSSYTICPGY